jgi:hypothetical protein
MPMSKAAQAASACTVTGRARAARSASISRLRATRNSHGRTGRSSALSCGRWRQARMKVSCTMSSALAQSGQKPCDAAVQRVAVTSVELTGRFVGVAGQRTAGGITDSSHDY